MGESIACVRGGLITIGLCYSQTRDNSPNLNLISTQQLSTGVVVLKYSK